MERWLPVAGYEGRYEVSDLGRVRSLQRKGIVLAEPIVLLPQACGQGYRANMLFDGEKYKSFYVHRLVLATFVGPPPEGTEGAHLDGVRTHNALANLQWVTRIENMGHKAMHGTLPQGEDCHNAKLTASQVIEARARWTPGKRAHSASALAREFGVSTGHMRAVLDGRLWSHIAVPARPMATTSPYASAGVENPNARLTEADVLVIRNEVRRIRSEGDAFGIQALAGRFGIHPGHVERVAYGRTWKHLPGAIDQRAAS